MMASGLVHSISGDLWHESPLCRRLQLLRLHAWNVLVGGGGVLYVRSVYPYCLEINRFRGWGGGGGWGGG